MQLITGGIMKKHILLLFVLLFSANTILFASEKPTENNAKKGDFFLALTSMSTESSAYTFMIDQLLEQKCKKPQSIETISKGGETKIHVLLALKNGNYEEAKKIINTISCEE